MCLCVVLSLSIINHPDWFSFSDDSQTGSLLGESDCDCTLCNLPALQSYILHNVCYRMRQTVICI